MSPNRVQILHRNWGTKWTWVDHTVTGKLSTISASETTNICYQTLQNIRAATDKQNKPIMPPELNVLKSMKTMIQSCHTDMNPCPGARPENLDARTLRTTANHCVTVIIDPHYQWTITTVADILQHINDPKQTAQSFAASLASLILIKPRNHSSPPHQFLVSGCLRKLCTSLTKW